jgi:hypothetical protein
MHVASWIFRGGGAKTESEERNFLGGEVEVPNIGGKRRPRSKQLAAMDSERHLEMGGEFSRMLQLTHGATNILNFLLAG